MGTAESQMDRLRRQAKWWEELEATQMDMAVLGDINLDWHRWSDPSYQLANLVDQVKLFLANTAQGPDS